VVYCASILTGRITGLARPSVYPFVRLSRTGFWRKKNKKGVKTKFV